jgi:type I restriction enzyme S subunit
MTDATRNLLEQHFDTAFAATGGIAKLRELILTLAMQGKLVKQDPNEPPASELLKEIEAEKLRLVKTGKIKQPKPLPPIKQEEVPYELPKGWEWVRLGSLIYLEMGQSPSSKYYNQEKDGLPFFQGKADFGDMHPTPRYWCTHPQKFAFPNDVLLSVRAPVGPTNIADIECCIGRGLAALRPLAGMGAKFINYLMIRFRSDLEERATGTTFVAVSKTDVENLIVPVIPLPEQHRIVARIDQLMARCDALEKLRKERETQRLAVHAAAIKRLLDAPGGRAWDFIQQHFGELYTVKENVAELRKAILQLAVMGRLVPQNPNDPPASQLLKEIEAEKQWLVKAGKIKKPKPLPPIKPEEVPYELPQGWKWVRLGDAGVFERGRSKHRPRNDKRLFEHGTYPFVQTGDVSRSKATENQILTCTSYYNDFGLKQSRLWEKGTLCITIAANIAETGFLGMDACIPDSVVAFLGVDKSLEKLVKVFIDVAKGDLEHFAPSTAQKNINLGIINELLFPLPPLPEQHRIIARIDQLMALCDTLDQQIDAATGKQIELLDAVMAEV